LASEGRVDEDGEELPHPAAAIAPAATTKAETPARFQAANLGVNASGVAPDGLNLIEVLLVALGEVK
jgi:hypothetical protein